MWFLLYELGDFLQHGIFFSRWWLLLAKNAIHSLYDLKRKEKRKSNSEYMLCLVQGSSNSEKVLIINFLFHLPPSFSHIKSNEKTNTNINYLVSTTTVSKLPATPMITTHGTNTRWKQYRIAANVSSSIVCSLAGKVVWWCTMVTVMNK